jgi:mono/diheme cytochrome c family protein
MVLGVKSRLDDARNPEVAAQMALQHKQELDYSRTPFEPLVETSGGSTLRQVTSGPSGPSVAQGRSLFSANGCSSCHGDKGTGTRLAPALVGVTGKYPHDQLLGLLRNPNPAMRAGGMPAVSLSADDTNALLDYLATLGSSAADVPARGTVSQLDSRREPEAVRSGTQRAHFLLTQANASKVAARSAAAGKQVFQSHACFVCHGEAGEGTPRAPALAARVAKLSDIELSSLLHDPNPKMRAGGMPPLTGSRQDVTDLTAYLRTLPAVPFSKVATEGDVAMPPQSTVHTVVASYR